MCQALHWAFVIAEVYDGRMAAFWCSLTAERLMVLLCFRHMFQAAETWHSSCLGQGADFLRMYTCQVLHLAFGIAEVYDDGMAAS